MKTKPLGYPSGFRYFNFNYGKEIIMRNNKMHTAQAINGEIRPYDWVIVTSSGEYNALVGMVTEIISLGSPEHDTGNATTVHIDFMDTYYSDKRKDEIIQQMSELYGEHRPFDELPLDDVILSPDKLIRITGIELCMFERLLESRETAEDYCNQIMKK